MPRLPRAFVPRARLWAHLDDATQGAVTLLVGPGGAGKTLGVSGWLRESGRADDTRWVQADESWVPERLLAVLDDVAGDEPRLVVVDDAHRLPTATVRALDARLDTAPDSFRVLLVSRWDLPFTRLGAELLGHFTSLRGELLRLDETESSALVAAHTHVDSAEISRAIAERTQGWCAAVVLTARAVAAAPDPVAVARRYAEGDASVADRVASEVFAALRPRERHLLLCVANEPAVTPALALHLSHDPRAGEALADLEAMGLLVTRVSPDGHEDHADDRDRYTIHPLLTEVVRRRTAAGGVDVVRAAATVRRAVQLDLARGETEHALRRLVDVGDHAGAARLLADEGPALILRGQGAGINAFALQQPSAIEVAPGAWFAIAAERWFLDEIGCARHWLDRIVADPMPETPTSVLQVACVRLMRSRLGLESMAAAVANAEDVLSRGDRQTADALVPVVLCELAITQNWLGDLPAAEVNLTTAARLSRSRDLPALTAIALSHLALTEYMRGREAACLQIAGEVLAMVEHAPWPARFSVARATLARELAGHSGIPWDDDEAPAVDREGHLRLHSADLVTHFWQRIQRSRVELAQGSPSGAAGALDVPLEAPDLPDHLAVVHELVRAFLAFLTGDVATLTDVHDELAGRGAAGEAALVAGFRADLNGDRRTAVSRFVEAEQTATYRQPAVRALALAAAAQLVHDLGDEEAALDLLHRAVVATEASRNLVPFLGWSRHGTQMRVLLPRLGARQQSPWLAEIAAGLSEAPSIATAYGPSTALPRELVTLPAGTIRPTLSPRERDVLYELARGSTYADIAANLFVSENTVKTHVSSLYGKLSVNRRSAALAAARSMNLL